MSASLFEVPLYFISEYFNGWVIVILVIIIIYFVALRNYYLKREQFFDKSMRLKEINEIEDIEEKITNNYNENNAMQKNKNNNKNNKNNKNKQNKKIYQEKNNQNKVKLKGTDIFERFEVMSTTSDSLTDKGFKRTSATLAEVPQATLYINEALVSTTLFNNLNLNNTQLQSCIIHYNEVINKYMSDLRKLNELKIKNEYLNTQKQFDAIILNGIDNIINYLNNVIKSPNILTRTSIRTDVINTLSTNIENLINKANNDLSIEINKLAKLDSTTINYEIMMKSIYDSRRNIENYIELDKFVSTYGRNISNYNRNINDILNKSNLLPIYESNFDKINQLINSDYNDDETKMSNKYGKAYTDYLSQMKKEDLDVNPMRLASQIESGIVNMLSNLYGSDNKNVSKYGKANNGEDNGEDNEEIIEQYNREYGNNNIKINNIKSNVIPKQQSNLVNNTNLNENANIYKDMGNLGSYLLDRNTQKQILEGFVDDTTTNNTTTNTTTNNPSTTNPSTTKPNINNVNGDLESKNKSKKTADIISSLLSGDFLQYVMEIMNDKLNMIYGMYNTKFNNDDNGYDKNGNKSNGSKTLYGNFKIEENMIPAGFLLFILSMFVYFIDTTS